MHGDISSRRDIRLIRPGRQSEAEASSQASATGQPQRASSDVKPSAQAYIDPNQHWATSSAGGSTSRDPCGAAGLADRASVRSRSSDRRAIPAAGVAADTVLALALDSWRHSDWDAVGVHYEDLDQGILLMPGLLRQVGWDAASVLKLPAGCP